MSKVALLTHLDVAIGAAAQSHAAPSTDAHGVDISSWKSGAYGFDACMAYLSRSIGGAVAISAGAYVAGYIVSKDEWYRIADLNAGAAIALTETLGYGQRVIDVGGFDRLAVVDEGDDRTHKFGFIPLKVE